MWALNLPAGLRRGGALPPEGRKVGAGNGVRTRDIQLGKLTLYQLSYARSSVRTRPKTSGETFWEDENPEP